MVTVGRISADEHDNDDQSVASFKRSELERIYLQPFDQQVVDWSRSIFRSSYFL